MEKTVVNGLVIKQINYGEADRILHIFTQELGIVSALAKGARKYKSHQGGAAQLLYYCQFTLATGKNMYSLQGASVLESFFDLSYDIEKLALCNYLFDITAAFVQEQLPDRPVLSLLLNTLYILKSKQRPLPLVKAVYELKLLSLSGFHAGCNVCCNCGADGPPAAFLCSAGGAVCNECATPDAAALTPATLAALRYILAEDADKIFSFSLPEEALAQLAAISEKFLLYHAEKNFSSLTYYKQMIDETTV